MRSEIQGWRAQIDDIDRQLLALLNERARLATRIGASKRAAGLPVRDPQREREVLARVRAEGQGPLSAGAVERVFRRIIRESRGVQAPVRVVPGATLAGGVR